MKNLICLIILGLPLNLFSQIFVDHEATGTNNGSSWTNAFNDLTEAIHASSVGDQLWLAAGTYLPGNGTQIRDTFFSLPHDLEIYGGFAGFESNFNERDIESNVVILSGDYNGDDINNNFDYFKGENAFHVIFLEEHISNNTIIDGLTIAYGVADDPDEIGGDRRLGGGILTYGTPIITNCTFNQNFAFLGAGLHPIGNVIRSTEVKNCTFNNNFAARGAGIYIAQENTIVDNCQFINNTASFFGGGLHDNTLGGIINNCFFINNQIFDGAGGGVFLLNNASELINCVFDNNNALDSSGGGLVYSSLDEDTPLTPILTNCTFKNGTAKFGGGVSVRHDGSKPRFVGCTFENNTATVSGGGLFIGSGAIVVLDSCEIISNEAMDNGGGIYTNSAETSVTITNSIIHDNHATSGGGFFLRNLDSGLQSELNIERSIISGNTSIESAAGISSLNSNLEISNSLFSNNSNTSINGAGGAISTNGTIFSVNTKITNTTFSGNTVLSGNGASIAQIFEGTSQSTLILQNNIFSHSTGENYFSEGNVTIAESIGGNLSDDDSMSNFLTSTNDINNADPAFIDPENLNYNLSSNSPCIDTGIEDGATITDILGNPRQGIVDKGAFEYQTMVGIDKVLDLKSQLKIFPNPVDKFVTVKLENVWRGNLLIQITDSSGKIIQQSNLNKLGEIIEKEFNLQDLPQGIYNISLQTESMILNKLFVKL